MLLLKRKVNESICIDNGTVKVVVVEIGDEHVKLGFTAARHIPIHRVEVQDRIERGADFHVD